MCALCGLLSGSRHWSNAGAPAARRDCLLQIARANRILSLFHLQLADFHGQAYVLSGPTGATELVEDLGQLWRAAEKMCGRPIDPLALEPPPQ